MVLLPLLPRRPELRTWTSASRWVMCNWRWTTHSRLELQPLERCRPGSPTGVPILQPVYLILLDRGRCSNSPAPPQTLELCTHGFRLTQPFGVTPLDLNVRTDLRVTPVPNSRLWEAAIPGPPIAASVNTRSSAQHPTIREPEDRPTRLAPRSGTRERRCSNADPWGSPQPSPAKNVAQVRSAARATNLRADHAQ